MRERLNLIGGQLFVLSRPGEGTTIRASVGLRPRPDTVGAVPVHQLASMSSDSSEVT
jgi:hypothetical protein